MLHCIPSSQPCQPASEQPASQGASTADGLRTIQFGSNTDWCYKNTRNRQEMGERREDLDLGTIRKEVHTIHTFNKVGLLYIKYLDGVR